MGGIIEFILEDGLGDINPQSREAPVKTPFKCPKFQHKDFNIMIDDEDDVDTKR